MTCRLVAVAFDALDPERLGAFWTELLRGSGFPLRFVATGAPKTSQNQAHLDLTSTSLADQAATVERATALGARHIDIGQRPEEGHVVLADPEGNELCVIGPGNNFLAGCPFMGCLASDGTEAVGRFWSAALGWPLVWDRDGETAIQAPDGGPKISWGGYPYAGDATRVRLEVAGDAGELIALGATRLGGDLLADPDGNAFVLTEA